MFIKEIILVSYLLAILLGVSGLTIALLGRKRERSDANRYMILFLAGMLVMCFYDMAIYYCDYVIGGLSNMKVLRIGNCIIAGTMYLWISLQEKIIPRQAMTLLNRLVKRYLVFYMAMWLLLTLFLSIQQFYTLKWLLLVTDVILMVFFLTASVGHLLYASADKKKIQLYYMILVTALLLWNYVSYFWGETSVYWGNSSFIREPLDLTIIFWTLINGANLIYEYRQDFLRIFDKVGKDQRESRQELDARIRQVCMDYKLTPRESEFIELIYSGKSNKEIAEVLFLSESTVKTHIYNIFRKMEVKNRVGVICIINGESGAESKPDEAMGSRKDG